METENSIADQMRGLIEDRLVPYRHTVLLVALVALLGVRALVGGTGVGAAIYSILVMLVLMVAVYTIQVDELLGDRELLVQQRRKRGFVGWALAIRHRFASGPIRFSQPRTSHGEFTFPAA